MTDSNNYTNNIDKNKNTDSEYFRESIKYKWKYKKLNESDVIEYAYNNSIPTPIAELMIKKGLISKEQLELYFVGSLKALHSPFDLLDMDKSSDRIAKAILNHELICIYGDYDVDGVTATSLMYLFLSQCNANVMYYIPNRLEEGYGLNKEAIQEIAKKGAKVIITVDCGISAIDEVLEAASLGMDIIVTDHHQPSDTLPIAAYGIINPMRADDPYPNKSLAGVGVAFKVIMAIRFKLRKLNYFKEEAPNIKHLLDIVTLGTIADVMPLIDENRIIVKNGLDLMSGQNARVGINELKKVIGITPDTTIKTYHIGFQIAPRINAMGRMGSSDKSLKLLITNNRQEAKVLAEELNNENKYRQTIERDILNKTLDIIDNEVKNSNKKSIVIAENGWHQGVIGIVASRVVDKYFKPTIILTDDNDVYKGSARSIPGFHLHENLSKLSDLLISYGGHKYAAGLKLEKSKIEEFKDRFDELVTDSMTESDMIPEINIDAELQPRDINTNLMTWIEKLEPYGQANKEPIFLMSKVTNFHKPSLVGKESHHLKLVIEKDGVTFEAIGFNMGEYYNIVSSNNSFDILFSLSYNYWKHRTIQLTLKDIRISE